MSSDDARWMLPSSVVRVLGDDGDLLPTAEETVGALSDDDHRALFRHMVVARRLDAQAIRLQRQGQLAVYASLLGQEAAQVGSASALRPTDWMFPSYREHGPALVRGLDMGHLAHQWRGTWLGAHDPTEHRFGMFCIPIGTQALHAAGVAMAAAFSGDDTVVMAYFGDGATSEGDPHEAMNFAAVYDAPCIFFVQNNQYAISTPLSEQTRAPTLAHKAIGYGMPGRRCDGNDVLAVWATVREAAARARRGEGPSLVEALTYRMEAHTTADDPTRYRTDDELDEWRRRDPIARYDAFLTRRKLLDEDLRAQIDSDADRLAAMMRQEITDAPHGDPLELFDHVYVDQIPELEEQRARLRAELSTTRGTDRLADPRAHRG